MAALLATGTSPAQSADFTLIATDNTSLFLVSTAALPSGAAVELQVKGANGAYYAFGALTITTPFLALSSPGTYRVSRTSAGIDVGVDRV